MGLKKIHFIQHHYWPGPKGRDKKNCGGVCIMMGHGSLMLPVMLSSIEPSHYSPDEETNIKICCYHHHH